MPNNLSSKGNFAKLRLEYRTLSQKLFVLSFIFNYSPEKKPKSFSKFLKARKITEKATSPGVFQPRIIDSGHCVMVSVVLEAGTPEFFLHMTRAYSSMGTYQCVLRRNCFVCIENVGHINLIKDIGSNTLAEYLC